MQALAKRAQLAFWKVEKFPNSDIAKAVLWRAKNKRNTGCYLKPLSKGLGISEDDAMEAVKHLTYAGLIHINEETAGSGEDFTKITLTEDADLYFATDVYGPRKPLTKGRIDGDKILHIMRSVEDLVKFYYRKEFSFPLEELEKLRDISHNAIKNIKADEKIFLHQTLDLPLGYDPSGSLCSFAWGNDPTTREGGYRRSKFEFRGEFDSPEEALAAGFDYAFGCPVANREFEFYGSKTNILPCAIQIEDRKKDGTWFYLELKNIRYAATEGCMDYQNEAKRVMPLLQERLQKALEYIEGE